MIIAALTSRSCPAASNLFPADPDRTGLSLLQATAVRGAGRWRWSFVVIIVSERGQRRIPIQPRQLGPTGDAAGACHFFTRA